MLSIDAGLDAINKEDAFAAALIAKHQARLEKAIQKLEKRILSLFDETLVREGGRLVNTKVKLKQAQKLHTKLTQLFEEEFGVKIKSVVKDFDQLAKKIERRFKAFDSSASFTDVTKEMIAALKSATLKEFNAFGVFARESVASVLYDAVIVSGEYATLKQQVSAVLTGKYSKTGRPMTSYTNQMVFDQTMSFRNQLSLGEADRAEISYFLYYGNIKNNTRSFCRRRAGNIYSRADIEKWTHDWDGKSGPPMLYRGGYNCRHSWVPVIPEWFEEKEKEIKEKVRSEGQT